DAFADLPATTNKADLPSPTGKGPPPRPMGGADLPAQRRPGLGEVDLPTVSGKADLPSPRGALGELDLPAIGGAGLPALVGPGLPAVAGPGLPAVAGPGLPAMTGGTALPAVQHAGRGSVDLPSVASAAAHLPAVPAPTPGGEMDPFAESAAPHDHDPFAHVSPAADMGVAQTMAGPGYSPSSGGGAGGGGFGDVELPGPGVSRGGGGGGGFGELELEAPAKPRAPSGDGGFGDLDIPAPEGFGTSPSAETFGGGGKPGVAPLMIDAQPDA